MTGGYLTFADETERSFKLPNHEITYEFRARLRDYYTGKYTVPTESFTEVTDRLNDLVSDIHNDNSYKKQLLSFQNSFKELLDELPEFKDISGMKESSSGSSKTIHGNEDVVHCIMSYMALQLYSVTRFGTEICLEKGRADVAFINRNLGTASVIELKYTKDSSKVKEAAESGMKQIEEKEYSKQLSKDYDVLLLGIGISQDKTIAICDKKLLLDKNKPRPKYFPSLLEYCL